MAETETLLDQEFLSRLEYLNVVTRELFAGQSSATRLSKRFGVGLEFADYRKYTPGDDFRHIDWAAYARRDDLLVKLFSEEQGAQVYLIVDASLSMSLGRPQKLLYAKKIAAALGYISLANLDPVAVMSFDSKLRPLLRSFQGRGQLQMMLQQFEAIQPDGQTALGPSIAQFTQRFADRRGIVVLLSDFLDRPGYEEAIRLLHHHRFDLVAVRVNDPEELAPTLHGDLELVDSETGEATTVQVTPELLADYRRRVDDHYAELARLCKAMRRRYLVTTTAMPFEQIIFDLFRSGGLVQ